MVRDADSRNHVILAYDYFQVAITFCDQCGKRLSGRQRRFCSRDCKNADTNNRLQNYLAQQERGVSRKLLLIAETGGCCTQCGYRKNLAALSWHHTDPASKRFELDLRSLSNRSLSAIRGEASRCMLLCANCHAELHFSHLSLVSAS